MKKILIILIAVISITLVAFFGWYLFLRDPDIPAGETIRNILPFGSGGDVASRPTTNNSQPTTHRIPVIAIFDIGKTNKKINAFKNWK